MGGEMIFTHNDKPIADLEAYGKLLKEMEKDCASLTKAAKADCFASICLIQNPVSNWKNGYIKRYGYRAADAGQDDDYELSVDLGQSTRNPDNHYYVLFPKDPNKFKILSNTHARGLNYYNKKWIHDYFLQFVTKFPGVFELYYGDGFCGYGEIGEIDYRDGSDVPVKRTYFW